MAWRESRPNLAKHSSYHNVSKILVVQESNVSSELNSDLVVRLCFSVTITTQEEGHYQPFIICKACVYKKSVKNELKVQTLLGGWQFSRMLCEVAFLQRRRLLGFHHHQTRGRCPLHRPLCLAKGLPRYFGIKEIFRMIPTSISQNRTLFQDALTPLYWR